jgi:catechol 2,3-dioxygenase-like lactoylglutathione lyase family enzyme
MMQQLNATRCVDKPADDNAGRLPDAACWQQSPQGFAMIGYVTLGINDLPLAAAFYDALLGDLGARRLMETERYIFWGVSPQQPSLCVIKPFDGAPASLGNGDMVALVADGRDKVDRLHAKALLLGGSDEGAPGDRGGGFYAGYFRDPEGHKLNVFCTG